MSSAIQKLTGEQLMKDQVEQPNSDLSIASYAFQVFLTDYYRRVKIDYKLDFDSFMVISVVMQHAIYESNKVREAPVARLDELKSDVEQTRSEGFFKARGRKLGINSISNVLEMPEETTRRKIENLVKKKILAKSKIDGIILGPDFLKRHSPFADKTIKSFKALIRQMNRTGLIEEFISEKQ